MHKLGLIFTAFCLTIYSCKQDTDASALESKSHADVATLLSPAEVKAIMDKGGFEHIFFIGSEQDYDTGHLKNAHRLTRQDYGDHSEGPVSGMRADIEQIQSLLRKYGVEASDSILIYDSYGNINACRLFWVLELYGFENAFLLNGALEYWTSLAFPLDTITPEIGDSSHLVLEHSKQQRTISGSFEDVLEGLDDPNTVFVDTRETYEYKGQAFIRGDEVLAFRRNAYDRGRIPGAIHLNWSELVDLSGDHRMKSVKDIQYNLEQAGIDSSKQLILYCQSGARSSHTSYILRHIMGYPRVKNYDGSWVEYSYQSTLDSTIPIEQETNEEEFRKRYDELILRLEDEKTQ